MAELDVSIQDKMGDSIPNDAVNPEIAMLLPNVPDKVFLPEDDDKHDLVDPKSAMPEVDDYTPELYDEYLTNKVEHGNLNQGESCFTQTRRRWESSWAEAS
jgi:hypothetical protein